MLKNIYRVQRSAEGVQRDAEGRVQRVGGQRGVDGCKEV